MTQPGETQFLELPTGRIAYVEYGAHDGEPVFYFHGWPSSRTQAAPAHEAARELGMRIISPDRPGVGQSTFVPNRRLLDWPPLLEQIADRLEIEQFRILAVSGGGPYALATAWAMPQRVQAMSVVCGAPPLADAPDDAGLVIIYRWLLWIHRTQPALVRRMFWLARPFARIPLPAWSRPLLLKCLTAPDAAALRDNALFDLCHSNFRGSWEGSAEGVITDAEIYAAPWGFPVEEVRAPVCIWHGKQDRNFSWQLSQALAARISRCRTRFIDDEGHFSLPLRRVREILEELGAAAS